MGILRLAKKYDAAGLFAEIKNILSGLFPNSYIEARRKLLQYHSLEHEYWDYGESSRDSGL